MDQRSTVGPVNAESREKEEVKVEEVEFELTDKTATFDVEVNQELQMPRRISEELKQQPEIAV